MQGIDPVLWAKTPPEIQQLVLTLLEQNRQLQEQVRQLQKRVQELEDRLGLNPRNSSQPPATEHPHQKPAPPPAKKKRKPGGQKGHRRHQRKLIPVDQCTEDFDLIPGHCRKCGQELAGSDPEPHRHQVWELPEIKPLVFEYRQHQLRCPCCQTTTTAPLPPDVPNGQAGPRLTAFAGLLMAYFRQSKRRCALFLETVLSLPASGGWMVKLQNRCTQSLQGTYQELCRRLPSQKVIRADESPTRERNRKAWLWTFGSDWMTVFAMRTSRGGEVVDEFLTPQFPGVVICDRFKSYYHIGQKKGHLQWCWSHLLRDFQALADSQTTTVSELGGRLVQQTRSLFRVWHRFRDGTIGKAGYRSAVGRIRQAVTALLMAGLRGDHARTSGICQEILQHREWLWTFLDHPRVELTNNASERALRHGVIWRKLSFGTQSESGSRFVGTLLTVIETCRQQKRNLFQFVTESVQRFFAREPALSLLPAAT